MPSRLCAASRIPGADEYTGTGANASPDPRERMAELGDLGFVEFRVDETAGLVRVVTLVWTGWPGPGQ